ncbi:MAG TPA: hypothetical protein VN704_06135 [Verrucomicrobiae bacterium]|nr:hypothetical protein [Verrucomicrobiae bacterium]
MKSGQLVIHLHENIGNPPPGASSSWAGMSGAALFAEDALIGVVLVDADPTHTERLELWALPANTFADNPSFIHWIRWDGGERKWNHSKQSERIEYYSWLSTRSDEPGPIDHKKATDYYIKNRSIENDIKDKINHKDNWNLSDHEAESLYSKDKEWKVEDFLKSPDIIKVIAAPFGTGKTCFAKVTSQNMINSYEEISLKDVWIPIYLSLKDKLCFVA